MSDSGGLHDPQTLAFYDREAAKYGARRLPEEHPRLTAFLGRLAPGAHVLDLGCGGGQDSAAMLARGFEVTAVDGSPGLAAVAGQRIGRPVQVLLFEDLAFVDAFDGVWANASLTHAPVAGLADILGRVRRALRPGGVFYAGYKAGDGGGRDALGRWFSYLTGQTSGWSGARVAPMTAATRPGSTSPRPGPPDPYSAGCAGSTRLAISLSNSPHTPASPSHFPRGAALEYSVERASKKLACSTPDSMDCSQGSGFSFTP
jgi:SAM-dependent methyltransferase